MLFTFEEMKIKTLKAIEIHEEKEKYIKEQMRKQNVNRQTIEKDICDKDKLMYSVEYLMNYSGIKYEVDIPLGNINNKVIKEVIEILEGKGYETSLYTEEVQEKIWNNNYETHCYPYLTIRWGE